jgi:lupus La protein
MAEFKALGLDFVIKALERAIEAEKNDALLEFGPKEGSDEIVNVRRKRPLEHDKTVWERTAYVVSFQVYCFSANVSQKGFGENESEATSQEKIEEYIAQFGVINAVRKRRGDKEGEGLKGKGKGDFKVSLTLACSLLTYKGSCFVEFKYLKDLEAFVARTDLPKFADEDMVVMTK